MTTSTSTAAFGYLEMAAVLDFFHFQQIDWK
jgi:hypothetical protein